MKLFKFHPGETIVLNFILPFGKYDAMGVVLSFRDRNAVVFEAMAASFTEEDDGRIRAGFMLTQAESLLFEENHEYKMQLNVYGFNSSRSVSDEILVQTLSQQLKDPGFGGDTALYNTYGMINGSGSGNYGGEQLDYNNLIHKPQINERTLVGNRNLPETSITNEQIDEITSSN